MWSVSDIQWRIEYVAQMFKPHLYNEIMHAERIVCVCYPVLMTRDLQCGHREWNMNYASGLGDGQLGLIFSVMTMKLWGTSRILNYSQKRRLHLYNTLINNVFPVDRVKTTKNSMKRGHQ